MCLQCHKSLSDEHVLNDLRDSVAIPKYEVWNMTSVSHLIIASLGTNGHGEPQDLANQLLEGYAQWSDNQNRSVIHSLLSRFIEIPTQTSALREKIRLVREFNELTKDVPSETIKNWVFGKEEINNQSIKETLSKIFC